MKVGVNGAVRDISDLKVGANGAVRAVSEAYIGVNGAVKKVWPTYSIVKTGTFSRSITRYSSASQKQLFTISDTPWRWYVSSVGSFVKLYLISDGPVHAFIKLGAVYNTDYYLVGDKLAFRRYDEITTLNNDEGYSSGDGCASIGFTGEGAALIGINNTRDNLFDTLYVVSVSGVESYDRVITGLSGSGNTSYIYFSTNSSSGHSVNGYKLVVE